MSFLTPLRYPGGKGRLTQFMGDVFRDNDLCDGHYVEGYAGGAGIAFGLLSLEYAQKIHLNDINRSIFSFWKSVIDHTDELCSRIKAARFSIEEWERQKAVQVDADADTVTLGYSTFFLNRTNRSGIISGGVIGGKDQSGPWKMDARFNKEDLIRRIQTISSYRSRISIYNLDAYDFIKTICPSLPQRSLVYLDPPYFVKGKGLYDNHYNPEDHKKIAEAVEEYIKCPWIVSYDNVEQIRDLYVGNNCYTFSLYYSAKERFLGKEVMFYSRGLDVRYPRPSRSMAA